MFTSSLSYSFLKKFLFSRRAGALIKLISWFCILGLMAGVASLVLIMSVMNGFNRSIKERKFSVEPHLVLDFGKLSEESIRESAAYQWILKQEELKFDLVESQDVILRTSDGLIQGALAVGTSYEGMQKMLKVSRWLEPNLESPDGSQLPDNGAYFGGTLADTLGLFADDLVTIVSPESLLGPKSAFPVFESLKVTRFVRTDIESIDAQKIFYQKGKAMEQLWNSLSMKRTLEVFLPDPELYENYLEQLSKYETPVESWKDRNANLFYSLKLEKFMVGLLLGVSTLIASFSLVAVMSLLITQKRRDMGLLMAIGFSPQKLGRMFSRLGLLLASFGIVTGTLIGVLLSLLVGRYSEGLLPNVYEETSIPTEIHWEQIGGILFCAFLFAFLVVFFSVRQVSKLTPVEALRR